MLPSILTASETCGRCGADIGSDQFCPSCGADRDVEVRVAIETHAIANARRWILGIGAWYLASTALVLFLFSPALRGPLRTQLIVVGCGMFAIHLGLWLWAKRDALSATLVALALFATQVLVNAVIDPRTILQGLLLKIIALTALLTAVRAGLHVQRLRRGVA